ncbi:MAG TPA: hypothetical protein VLW44_14695 [Streptosporangiaceae bacterium]|nr:hypothetical protein [Streptosporangiaceae bacterium]
MPGQPGPVYPPGQFSTWNRLSVRASWLGMSGNGDGSWEGDAEPGYSVLATSDPAADATATQTWAAMDETDSWSPPPMTRDVSAHTDGEGFPRIGRPGGRAAAASPQAFEAAAPAQAARGRQPAPWESGSLPAAGPSASGAAALAAGAAPAGARGAPPRPGGPGDPHATGRASARHGQAAARGTGEFRRAAGGSGRAPAPASAGHGSGGLAGLSHRTLIALLMTPVVIVILVVAVIVYLGSRPVTPAGNAVAAPSSPAVAATPTPSLGPWRDITSQAVDTTPLTLAELFPARFTANGGSGTRTVEKASAKCTGAVIGSALRTAIRKGACTQVMRASYLSANRKEMATIGVLNLLDVTAAEKAGKASGAAEFIRQLPAAHGPTRNLTKGTGLEEAEVKGHYLILIWTEFANLHAPTGKKQRRELTAFSADLFAGTANLSLTSRMVTGKPLSP